MFFLFIIIMSFIYTFAVRELLYKNLILFDFIKAFIISFLLTIGLSFVTGHFYGIVYFFIYLCIIHFLEFYRKMYAEKDARHIAQMFRSYEEIKDREERQLSNFSSFTKEEPEEEIYITKASSNKSNKDDNSKSYKIIK